MTELPSGIVAFLMTDVEDSTQAWNRSGSSMESSVAALDADITSVVERHRGSLVKARGEGDSHFGAFASASDAVAAAAAVQRRADLRLAVRACILLGEAEPHDGDYVGAIINHGARVRSAAHGGQVLATRSVVDVASLPAGDDLSFHPLGSHQLRDVPTPIELHQLCGAGLRATFPPLRTAAHTASSLMTVVIVDEVGASRHLEDPDDVLMTWQRSVIRSLRDDCDRHDGRFLKLVGDGCIVGFEDPRQALDFTAELPVSYRAGVAIGLVEVVEGELVGRPVFDAHTLVRQASAGEVRCCPVTEAICTRVP